MLAPLGSALGVWLVGGAISELAWRAKISAGDLATSWARFKGLPRSAFGTALAHAGLGIMVLGIVGVTAWRQEIVLVMNPGESREIAGMVVKFEGETSRRGPNYQDTVGTFTMSIPGSSQTETMETSKRVYIPSQQPTSEVAIRTFLSGDLYVVMGDKVKKGRTVRLYFNPLIPWIWLGTIIMFFGALISLSDRRYRVGAPKRAKVRVQEA